MPKCCVAILKSSRRTRRHEDHYYHGSNDMNNYWRVAIASGADSAITTQDPVYRAAPDLLSKLRPRHGLVMASWRPAEMTGHVQVLGIVLSVNILAGTANVHWVPADITLKPNPSGCRFWTGRAFFKFAPDVAVRYMLDDLFAEHFADEGELSFESSPRGLGGTTRKAYVEIPGYVYLIKSDFGYKIGKTVNIKSRTSLFDVRLPFPIKLINYAWYENYTAAERALHVKFGHKRLEGEWFDLDASDIAYICGSGKRCPCKDWGD